MHWYSVYSVHLWRRKRTADNADDWNTLLLCSVPLFWYPQATPHYLPALAPALLYCKNNMWFQCESGAVGVFFWAVDCALNIWENSRGKGLVLTSSSQSSTVLPGTTDNYRLCHTVTWPLVQCTCQRWWRASSCQEPGSPIQDGVMVDITGDWQILYPMDGQDWDLQTVLKGVVFSVLLRTANSQLHTLHVNSRCVMLLYLPLRFVVG